MRIRYWLEKWKRVRSCRTHHRRTRMTGIRTYWAFHDDLVFLKRMRCDHCKKRWEQEVSNVEGHDLEKKFHRARS